MLFLYGTYSNKNTLSEENAELSLDFAVPMIYIDNWKKCGLVANFFGQYQSVSFKKHREKVNSILSTITNELLENAVKFACDKALEIHLRLKKQSDTISIETYNVSTKENAEKLIKFTETLAKDTPENIFLKTIEENSTKEEMSELGLITIFKDYSDQIGIKITKENQKNDTYAININLQINEKALINI
ncbi:hypothetical protein DID76_02215 [Candidatus Marinamargulisbacteria bacterium SCGC AG-414-C22]|nr:hypothetical protein DID76_02215 [Candidatus Marinamargulisbacteria bacterium SCGC AG-414-C22]